MDIPLDEVIYVEAIASSSTGAAVDADSTPTFAVFEEDTDTDIGVGGNMTKRTSLTGNYRASFTASAANGFEVGKWYSVIGSATIGTIATKGVLKTFRIVAAESIAGYPKTDQHALKGDAQSATDLKDFADDGYDPSTNKVQGVVLVDTTTDVTNGVNVTQFNGSGTPVSTLVLFAAALDQATGQIDAGTLANNTLTAAALAADAVAEIAAAINGSGTGARTITVTVNDGSVVLQNARVRLTEGVNSYVATTNASGVATLNVDDATYTVGVTKSGYTFAGTTLVVDGNEAPTYSMTAVVVTPPTNPSLSAIEVLCLGTDETAESGIDVDFRIVTIPSGDQNKAYSGAKRTVTSDVNGIARIEVAQGSTYEYKRGVAQVWNRVTVDADGVTNVTSFIGSP